jgi:hypothetical protein
MQAEKEQLQRCFLLQSPCLSADAEIALSASAASTSHGQLNRIAKTER